jgi:hypothetical protein
VEDAGTPLKVAVEYLENRKRARNDFPFDQDFSDGYDSSTFF